MGTGGPLGNLTKFLSNLNCNGLPSHSEEGERVGLVASYHKTGVTGNHR